MKRARLVPPAVAAVLLAGAGTAFGYFTSTGSGAASASTGSLTVSIAATTGTPGAPLQPGGTGDVTLQVHNPNSAPVTLVSVTGNGPVTASGGLGTCTTTGVSFADQAGLSITIPAGATQQIDLPGAASMDATSQNGCQGATFSIPVTVTVRS
jgi:hypothetical protein